jgi:multiple sugar transport system ATP-binding protein
VASVDFQHVWKYFGEKPSVSDLCLHIDDGEFMVLVGPSGCGKTTTMRMLAGLERASYGEIRIDEKVVNALRPGKRDIAMVFQSYALFPHMSVYENLAFGPRSRGEKKRTFDPAVRKVAETMGLVEHLGRRPAALSGGQRQRVALARALLRTPRLFLMDEPLSNLDAALRLQMRVEIAKLQRELGVTTLYVTHDQVEAMTMGHRIAIMKDGVLQQVGGPEEVYNNPATSFVAASIGTPRINLVEGALTGSGDGPQIEVLGQRVTPPIERSALDPEESDGGSVTVGLRPTDLQPATDHSDGVVFPLIVDAVEPMGPETFVTGRCGDQIITARFPADHKPAVLSTVSVRVDPAKMYLFSPGSGRSILDRTCLAGPLAATTYR